VSFVFLNPHAAPDAASPPLGAAPLSDHRDPSNSIASSMKPNVTGAGPENVNVLFAAPALFTLTAAPIMP
jgi:hypothetical protein